MNERIRELAEQAEEQTRVKCNNAYWRMSTELPEDCMWQEKFAELIIEKVFDSIANEGFEVYEPVIQKVKQSFGVE